MSFDILCLLEDIGKRKGKQERVDIRELFRWMLNKLINMKHARARAYNILLFSRVESRVCTSFCPLKYIYKIVCCVLVCLSIYIFIRLPANSFIDRSKYTFRFHRTRWDYMVQMKNIETHLSLQFLNQKKQKPNKWAQFCSQCSTQRQNCEPCAVTLPKSTIVLLVTV